MALAATLTEGATVNTAGALLESVTTVLPAEDFDSVTVQVVLPLEARLAVLHCREDTIASVVREIVADWDEPFRLAVMLADWSARSEPVLAVKVAEVALAATLTEGGTVSTAAALLASVTTLLLVVDLDRVTVQVVLAFAARLVAAHCREDTAGRVVSESVADLEDPFRVAVSWRTGPQGGRRCWR